MLKEENLLMKKTGGIPPMKSSSQGLGTDEDPDKEIHERMNGTQETFLTSKPNSDTH